MKFRPVCFTGGLILLFLLFFIGCRGPRVLSDHPTYQPAQKEKQDTVKLPPSAATRNEVTPKAQSPTTTNKEKMAESRQASATEKETPSVEDGNNIVSVTASRLNFRSCPGIHCRVLTVLRRGDLLIQTEMNGEWIRVRVKSTGQEGWVSSRYVRRESLEEAPSNPKDSAFPTLKEEWAIPEKNAGPPSPTKIKEEYIK